MFKKLGKFARKTVNHVKHSKFGKAIKKTGHLIKKGGHHLGHAVINEGKTIGKHIVKDVKQAIKDPIGTIGTVADAMQKTGGDPSLMTLGLIHPKLYNTITNSVSKMRDIAGKVVETATGGEIPADTLNNMAKKGVDILKGLKDKNVKKKYLDQAKQFALTYAPNEIKHLIPDAVKSYDQYEDYKPKQEMIIDEPRIDDDNKTDITDITDLSDTSKIDRSKKYKDNDDKSTISVNSIPPSSEIRFN